MQVHVSEKNWIVKSNESTSNRATSYSQCSKLILSYTESGAVVSCDSQIIPCGWLQIKEHKITTWLNIVGHFLPFRVISEILMVQIVFVTHFKCEMKWISYFFLYSITKCDIEQLPSFHANRCNLTEFDDGSLNFELSGDIGFVPLVRVLTISEATPAPMLFGKKSRILRKIRRKTRNIEQQTKNCTTIKKVPWKLKMANSPNFLTY